MSALTDSQGGPRAGLQEIVAASGISARLWRLYAAFWFVCLLFPILSLIQAPPAGYHLAIPLSGMAIFVATYFWVMWPHPLNVQARDRLKPRISISLLAGLTLLVSFLSLNYGSSFLWLFIGVSAIAGMTLSFRMGSIAVFALTLLTLGAGLVLGPETYSPPWLQVIPLVLLVRGLGLDMIGFLRLSDALRELHAAREELARQAVTEERLRMARDLHDLLGHTLSMIALKSDLAERLMEKEPRAAGKEIGDVERAARQALREVRAAVAGYRGQTLRGELEAARQILGAAGVACTIEYDGRPLSPQVDSALAWAVREGTTNVIRHSRAAGCLIRIRFDDSYVRAEIENDGGPRSDRDGTASGAGLSGLRERMDRLGGEIESGSFSLDGAPGYRLSVMIPIGDRARREAG